MSASAASCSGFSDAYALPINTGVGPERGDAATHAEATASPWPAPYRAPSAPARSARSVHAAHSKDAAGPAAVWIAAAVAAALAAGAVAVMASGSSGPSRADEWDPRVADLVQFVQTERGLLFDHPVRVDFLTPEEYSDVVASESG